MDPGGQGARGPKRASEAKQDPLRLKKRPRDKSDVPPPRRNKHNNTADGQPPTNKGSGGKCPLLVKQRDGRCSSHQCANPPTKLDQEPGQSPTIKEPCVPRASP